MNNPIPIFNIEDIEQALEFYIEILDFKILQTIKDKDGKLMKATVARGNSRLIVVQNKHIDNTHSDSSPKIYLFVDNLLASESELSLSG